MRIQPTSNYSYSAKIGRIKENNPTFGINKSVGKMVLRGRKSVMKRIVQIFKDAPDEVIKEYTKIKGNDIESFQGYKKLKSEIGYYKEFQKKSESGWMRNYDPCGNDYARDIESCYVFGLME